MNVGRPKKADEPKIKAEIMKCFLNGDNILGASDKLGYNKETINNYYREFSKTVIEDLDKDFVNRQKTSKEIALLRLNKVIDEIMTHFGILKEKAADEFDNDAWDRNKIAAMALVGNLIQQRADIEMCPTIDVDIEQMVANAIKSKEKILDKKPGNKPQK